MFFESCFKYSGRFSLFALCIAYVNYFPYLEGDYGISPCALCFLLEDWKFAQFAVTFLRYLQHAGSSFYQYNQLSLTTLLSFCVFNISFSMMKWSHSPLLLGFHKVCTDAFKCINLCLFFLYVVIQS